MLYSPCVVVHDPSYCNQQFNNQLQQLHHALAVATALQRVLVLPPMVSMSHQDAEQQHWFRLSHFVNVTYLARRFPVVEWHEFVEREGEEENDADVHNRHYCYMCM